MSTAYDSLPDRPRPVMTPENAPYWAALREHRLVIQRCAACGKLRHYPRPMCDACYAFDHDWQTVAPRGTVHSWSTSHHPFHAGFKRDLPYTTLTIDLDAGVRMQATLARDETGTPTVGARVEIAFEVIDDTLTLPCARLAAGT